MDKRSITFLLVEDDDIHAHLVMQHHANSDVVKPVDFDKFRELVNDLCLYWSVWNVPSVGVDS